MREELGDALERFAFSRLDEENRLHLAGRFGEAAAIAFWRQGVRDAADLVRTWTSKEGSSPRRHGDHGDSG